MRMLPRSSVMLANAYDVSISGKRIELSNKQTKLYEKYLERYRAGTNLALLAPEVRAAFPTDEAVNQALRSLMQAQGA